MTFTAEDLDRAIDAADNDEVVGLRHYGGIDNEVYLEDLWREFDSYKWVEIPGFGRLEVVEYDGGGEGHGEYIYLVFKIGDRYFRKTGYYASFDGSNWDGSLEEVEPFEKTVTDYRRV